VHSFLYKSSDRSLHKTGLVFGQSFDEFFFGLMTVVELVGSILLVIGIERLAVDLLIIYLVVMILTHIVFTDYRMFLFFVFRITVLGLLLYARELLQVEDEHRDGIYDIEPDKAVETTTKKVAKKSVAVAAKKKKTPRKRTPTPAPKPRAKPKPKPKPKPAPKPAKPKPAEKKAAPKSKPAKKKATLERIAKRAETIDFGTLGRAEHHERDDLQRIKGIGPFIEEKLHALGIYTFLQISRMTPKIEDDVNHAIEFFIGRIRRDEWMRQATEFVAEARL
jgi:predicted flap endonuclease-1-like 5' DNA nuclease